MRLFVLLGSLAIACSQTAPLQDAGTDAAPDVAACTVCNPGSGLCAPAATCTTADACTQGVVNGVKQTITTPITLPTCKTAATSSRAMFDDSPPRTWTDAVSGEARGACVFRPTGASAGSLRPLVVFFHGGDASADTIYDSMSLRAKAETYVVSGDAARPGFVLAADQGRNLHNANGNGDDSNHDFYYRDAASPSTNPDFRNADKLVDDLVAEGDVDPKRIYAMGWSNGTFFAQAYAIARHDTATPGGNVIAAAAVYAGADPFEAPIASEPDCTLSTKPASTLPIYLIHRACDSLVACNAGAAAAQGTQPGFDVETWLATLQAPIGDTNATDVIIDGAAVQVSTCAATCTKAAGLLNHIHWPDGVADGSGVDWEPKMLDFLAAHPHG